MGDTDKYCFSIKVRARKRPSLIGLMGMQRQMSARTKAGMKWLSKVKKTSQVAPKESTATGLSIAHLQSPLGSQLSFANATRIEHVADWEAISKKYRALMGEAEEVRESASGEDDERDEDETPQNSS